MPRHLLEVIDGGFQVDESTRGACENLSHLGGVQRGNGRQLGNFLRQKNWALERRKAATRIVAPDMVSNGWMDGQLSKAFASNIGEKYVN